MTTSARKNLLASGDGSGTQPPSPEQLLPRIRALRGNLAPTEDRIAAWLLEQPSAAAQMSITRLAESCSASETTVVRFCRHIGFPGYRAFRTALIMATARQDAAPPREEPGGDIDRGDPMSTVMAKISVSEARAVEDTLAQLDVASVEAAVAALAVANRVEVFGIGASGLVAEDLQQKLHRIDRPAFVSRDPHAALTSTALLGADDVAVGISHTGQTRDTLDPLVQASHVGASTIAITNNPRSALARAATHLLTTATVETTFRSGAMASRTAQLVIVDCLFVGVVQATYERSVDALARTLEAVRDRREGNR